MIRTRAALFSRRFSVALLLLLMPAQGLAQGLPKVPPELKTSNEVASHRQQLEQFMSAAAKQLETGTPDQQKEARDALGREITINGQPTASAAYTTLYAQLLNSQLQNLAKHQDTRVRLNAAVALYSVARIAGGATLVPAAKDFINDAQPAVVLWGVKAGRALVPAELRAFAGNATLPKEIVSAAKKHPKGTVGGAICVDTYDALSLDISTPATANALTPAMIQAVIPHIHELMAFRVGEFRKGVPAEPGAERSGAGFLVNSKVWPLQNPNQQQKTIQLLSDLVALAAQQSVAPKVSPIDQGYLVRNVIPNLAASLSVAAASAKEAGIVAAVAPVALPKPGIMAAAMDQFVKAIYPAIKASKTFGATTNAPPSVTGNEAAPAPASAPTTTGPVAIPGAGAIPIAAPGGAATRPAGAAAPGARPTGSTPPPPGGTRPPAPPPGVRPPPPGASSGK